MNKKYFKALSFFDQKWVYGELIEDQGVKKIMTQDNGFEDILEETLLELNEYNKEENNSNRDTEVEKKESDKQNHK